MSHRTFASLILLMLFSSVVVMLLGTSQCNISVLPPTPSPTGEGEGEELPPKEDEDIEEGAPDGEGEGEGEGEELPIKEEAEEEPPPGTNQAIIASYTELRDILDQVPDTVLDPSKRQTLQDLLDESQQNYEQGDPCGAASILQEYMQTTQDYRQGAAIGTIEDLYNLGRMIRYDMLTADKIECPGAERVGVVAAAVADDQHNDNTQLVSTITFGEPKLQTREVDGQIFTLVDVPGADVAMGDQGLPGVPVLRRLVAVPRDAQVTVQYSFDTAETIQLNLYPFQEIAIRQPLDDPGPPPRPPFVMDETAYQTNTAYPQERVAVHEVGQYRDVRLVALDVATSEYNPVSNILTLFSNSQVSLNFTGGSGAFVTEDTLTALEVRPAYYSSALLNGARILDYIEPRFAPLPAFTGEEFMILTHPRFKAAADRLAIWKRRKGITTTVFEVNDGPGAPGPDTKEEIDRFIEREYDTADIRPQYVLLLGDAEFIPPFYHPDPNPDPNAVSIASDWTYACYGPVGLDWVPDFAVGRIPVDTLAEADVVVNKIINYESTPPTDRAFYRNVSLAGEFDCCQRDERYPGSDQWSFIRENEVVRNILAGRGYTVQRIYQESLNTGACPEPDCIPPIPAYTADTTPRRFDNRSLLPGDLGPGSGFAWNGSTTGIANAWNAGRFLMIHDDHANSGMWWRPAFSWVDVDNLANGGRLPVVFGINCQSGLFDNEISHAYGTVDGAVYFSERLLRKSNGGAIGVIAATRNTPGPVTDELYWSLIDATWPNAEHGLNLPESKRRLGDILNHAKLRLLSIYGRTIFILRFVTGEAQNAMYLWNLIGDPTLEMWTAYPYDISLPTSAIVLNFPNEHYLSVGYNRNDATIAAWHSDNFLGRAQVTNSLARIDYGQTYSLPPEAQINLSVSYPNAISRYFTVQLPDELPPANVTGLTAAAGDREITLQWTNPTTSDFAGVVVLSKTSGYPTSPVDGNVIYNGNGQTFTHTGLPNGTRRYYTVFAYDEVPNYSSGVRVSAVPSLPIDTVPPDDVTNFFALGDIEKIVLTWANPADADFAGVRIQRSTTDYPKSPTDGDTVFDEQGVTFTDLDVKAGTTYYYTAFAHDQVPNYAAGVQASAIPTAP